jgi:cell fate regulator YaaT (PSP1 superfamily)
MEHHTIKENVPKQPDVKTVFVRFGHLGQVGEFNYRGDIILLHNQPVILETERGIELGNFLGYSCEVESGLQIDQEQVKKYLDESGPEYLKRSCGKVIRPANHQDLVEERHIRADSMEKKRYCMEMAERMGLRLDIICVEHLFGGERIIFYFMAEGRVDFRDMVKELAREYQTRIELRQIGSRDEARLLADYEICGRQCCCKNFLKTLRPVNMKMAKLQKATLDPSKVSGRCGRLRCCLRYEQKAYEDLVARLPNVGNLVQTPQGVGRVKDRSIITQLVQVAFEDRIITFPIEEISPAPDKSGGESTKPPALSTEDSLNEDIEGDVPPASDQGDNDSTILNPQDKSGGNGNSGHRSRRNRNRRRR